MSCSSCRQIFLVEPPERLPFQTLDVLQHEVQEFISQFLKGTTVHNFSSHHGSRRSIPYLERT
jgi:hypothetical protein